VETVSIQRTHNHLISAISGLTISTGSLYKMSHDFALGLTDVFESIRTALLAKQTPVHYCDESGARTAGASWLGFIMLPIMNIPIKQQSGSVT
jgi:hypothetical protein